MTFRLDDRAGSKDLFKALHAVGVPVELARLPAGDIEMVGKGPEGRPLVCCVEYKQLSDVLACVRNGRFAEQAREMYANAEIRWLLVEGRIRIGRNSLIDTQADGHRWYTPPGRYTYQEVAAWLTTMAHCAGVLLWRTESQQESVEWLRTLWLWLSSSEWQDHRAHMDWYTPPLDSGGDPWACERGKSRQVQIAKTLRSLPRIGTDKARRLAGLDKGEDRPFRSLWEAFQSSQDEWQRFKGVGKKDSATIVRTIRDGEDEEES